jgi:hypothetical protein
MVNARQTLMVRAYLAIVQKVGPWTKGTGADGAGYVPAAQNGGSDQGFACEHCMFFRPAALGCDLVKGSVEAQGLCRLHVIPQEHLSHPRAVRLGGGAGPVNGTLTPGRIDGRTVE